MHVTGALAQRYRSEAYFVPYIVRQNGKPIMRQPRVNKAALPWLRAEGYEVTVDGLVVDVDRPNHEPWASREEALLAAHQAKRVVPYAIVYTSRGGLRIVQPVIRPMLPEDAEGALAAFLRQLESVGIVGDRACLDWTHGYRLPHVARSGGPTVDALAMLLDYQPIEPPRPITVARRSRRGAAPAAGPIAWTKAIPDHLTAAVEPIALALRDVPGPTPGWHATHLAIAGALASCGVDPGHLPAFARAVASETGDSRPDDRETGARTTAERWARGSEIAGRRWLEVHAPGVAAAVAAIFGEGKRRLPVLREPEAPTTLPEVARLQIERAIETASEELTLVVVPCGVGKTRALRRVAERRARKEAREGAKRAPLGSRTCISVPTHELAVQIQADLKAAGIECARLIGIASHTTDGKPTCAYHLQAQAIASGGLSVRRELCDGRGRPCEWRATCAAREGMDGESTARVVVGPHALVGQLDGMAGSTGLLAIDEPPAMLRVERYSLEDLDHALANLDRFGSRYAEGVRPALVAVRAWLAGSTDVEPGPIARAWAAGIDADALERAHEATGAESVEEAAAYAVEEGARSDRPPLTADAAFYARCSVSTAKSVGRAARVLADIREAVLRPDASVATVESPCSSPPRPASHPESHGLGAVTSDGREAIRSPGKDSTRGTDRFLVLTLVSEALRRAVRREGAIIVLAADADLHAPLLARAVGYEPRLVQVEAALGAPVRRVLLESPASRSRWINRGRVEMAPVMAALQAGIAELERAGVRSALVVTWLAVEEALRASPEAMELLAQVGGELAHFGALRGLDRWKGASGCLTLGDPRPNLGDVAREIAILREGDVSERLDALAAAELEQAHGRLRLVHRTEPATLVHVGEVLPRGWCRPVERRPMQRRPGVPLEELRRAVAAVGGTSEAARLLEVEPAAVRRWQSGARAPPPDVLRRLRVGACGSTSVSDGRKAIRSPGKDSTRGTDRLDHQRMDEAG
jgi:hypothetical protein